VRGGCEDRAAPRQQQRQQQAGCAGVPGSAAACRVVCMCYMPAGRRVFLCARVLFLPAHARIFASQGPMLCRALHREVQVKTLMASLPPASRQLLPGLRSCTSGHSSRPECVCLNPCHDHIATSASPLARHVPSASPVCEPVVERLHEACRSCPAAYAGQRTEGAGG